MTLEELCSRLSISEATGKNWLRLGKISPDVLSSPEPSFSKEYADSLIEDISSGKVKALISRRNKKYVSGSFFYDSYVPKDSDCLPKVREISKYL
ncbi:MAG: DNA methyltransferase, partial [Butyrivibrio sp.]|nr:DNA methyltransferase [Butyrivibrio sp.]